VREEDIGLARSELAGRRGANVEIADYSGGSRKEAWLSGLIRRAIRDRTGHCSANYAARAERYEEQNNLKQTVPATCSTHRRRGKPPEVQKEMYL
jgi:hypothetical protein